MEPMWIPRSRARIGTPGILPRTFHRGALALDFVGPRGGRLSRRWKPRQRGGIPLADEPVWFTVTGRTGWRFAQPDLCAQPARVGPVRSMWIRRMTRRSRHMAER